jgi:hypothetical protein
MSQRESTNRIKIEKFRISQVAVNSAEDIFQGDLMCWDAANRRATRLTSAIAASAANFIGMSDTKVLQESAGSTSFLSPIAAPRVNIVQDALVEVCWGTTEQVFAFDTVVIGTDAQTCVKGASNPVGVVDPGFAGPSGYLATASGIPVKIWLRVPAIYRGL